MRGVQVWIGYNQSLRPCQSGLTLNTDITAAAFLEGQPMLQLIGGTVGMMDISRGLNPQQVRSINKAVRGVQVRALPCPPHAPPPLIVYLPRGSLLKAQHAVVLHRVLTNQQRSLLT